jgi:3-deoxy-7-phosphoheptulonate synthase
MHNYELLKELGKISKPVLLKRGLAAYLDELVAASEYILREGNSEVILCERGIRSFERATRNTLDLAAVPYLQKRTGLPVIVDPSHGTGVRDLVSPMCWAAAAAGADGIIVEVHPNPAEALSDGPQAMTLEGFERMVPRLIRVLDAVEGPKLRLTPSSLSSSSPRPLPTGEAPRWIN